jgi:GntR family transcriptional regulator, transcriptional repressor for pyruvate dehydrogenase complex
MSKAKSKASPPNAARVAVHKLREIILARPEGALLGSEDELASALGVGRATLRQTARLLEHEHLLRVKRGVGGGYYGHRPDSRAVTGAAATYLRIHTPTFLDLLVAAAPLHIELARLAAQAPVIDRSALAATVEAFRDETISARRLTDSDIALRERLYELAKNPFLELVLRVHLEICLQEFREPILDSDERIEVFRRNRLGLATAVLERDDEFAAIHARRGNELILRWTASMKGETPRMSADLDETAARYSAEAAPTSS